MVSANHGNYLGPELHRLSMTDYSPSQQDDNVILGSQLLSACQNRNRDAVHNILSRITCFDSLKITDQNMVTAYSHALHNEMPDVATEISDKEFSFLINACKDNDLKRFEYICARMARDNLTERNNFRHERYSADDLTLILSTYSNLLEYNFENGRMITFDLNSIIARPLPVEASRHYSLKRCKELNLQDDDGDSISSIDKISNIVLESQLLNACERGDRDAALNVLSKITCFDSLKKKCAKEKTAFKLAMDNKIEDVAMAIHHKKFSLLLDACKNGNLVSFMHIYKLIGWAIFRYKHYSATDLALILGTCSDVLKDNWEKGQRPSVILDLSNGPYKSEPSNRQPCVKRCGESSNERNVCMKPDDSIPLNKNTPRDIELGLQLLNACKNEDSALVFEIVSQIKNYYSLKVQNENNETPFVCAIHHKMRDAAMNINDKKFSLLLDACDNADLDSFMFIYNDINKLIPFHKKYSPEDLALIANTHSMALSMR